MLSTLKPLASTTASSPPPPSSSGLRSKLPAASFLSPWAHLQDRLRLPLIPCQVRWLLEPNDIIHVQVNNQTVAFEINREDPEGRLGTAVSHFLLLPWVRLQRGTLLEAVRRQQQWGWGEGLGTLLHPLFFQQLGLGSFFTQEPGIRLSLLTSLLPLRP